MGRGVILRTSNVLESIAATPFTSEQKKNISDAITNKSLAALQASFSLGPLDKQSFTKPQSVLNFFTKSDSTG